MRINAALVVLFSTLAIGCQAKLADQRSLTLTEPGEIATLIVDAVPKSRALRVAGSATEPVDVFVYLEENQAAAERMITFGKGSDHVVANVQGDHTFDLVATIPADEAVVVMVRNASRASNEVNLALTD